MNSNANPSLPLRALAPIAVVAACVLWAFGATLIDLARVWNGNPQYSHGSLVPVFAAFLLWMRRSKLDPSKIQPSAWGLALLAAGLTMRLGGTYWHYIWFEQFSLVPCVAGIVLMLGGWAGWKWAWPAVLFLVFMIPLPYRLANSLSGPLQRLATISSTFVMQSLGLPALAEGNTILLNENVIGIVEACSGLRMLVVFFALSTAVVLVIDRHWIDKLIVFASAIPIALLANIARVTLTGVMYETGWGEEAARHFFHDLAGWLMMPLALGMLWAELALLNALFTDTPDAPARPAPSPTRKARAVQAPAAPRPPRQRSLKRTAESRPASPEEAPATRS